MSGWEVDTEDLASPALDAMAERASNPEPFYRAAARLLTETLIPEEFSDGGPPGGARWDAPQRGGQRLLDTGQLVRSFFSRSTSTEMVVGTAMRQAALLHFGGTIRPKSGKYLTVPLPTLSVSERRQKKARDFDDTFFARSKNGNLILFEKTGEGPEDIRPLFVLKESVTIPASPFLAWWPPWVDDVIAVGSEYLATGKV